MTVEIHEAPAAPGQQDREAARVGIVFMLAQTHQSRRALHRREGDARLDLGAAILAMDNALERGEPAIAEQAAVERAMRDHASAFADLLRGEANSCEHTF